MASRYFRRSVVTNDSKLYEKYLERRGAKNIQQYRTPVFNPVSDKYLDTVEVVSYIIMPGDAFWKLSSRVYGDSQYWWVIASFNRVPTVAHLKVGDVIKIPVDLATALEILE